MKNRLSRSFWLISSIFYAPALFAQTVTNPVDAKVTMNSTAPNYTNDTDITTEDGYGIWVDGYTGFDGKLINTGSINVTGDKGFGIYETPYQTRPVKLTIDNTGTIQRIQLEETAYSTIYNGKVSISETDGTISKTEGKIQGAVLLGAHGQIYNNSGSFTNFDRDSALGEKGNLIAIGSGYKFSDFKDSTSRLINGSVLLTQMDIQLGTSNSDVKDTISLIRPIFTTATITTDHIRFAENGLLDNRGFIDNQSIVFGDGGVLSNTGMPYTKYDSDGSDEDATSSVEADDSQTTDGTQTAMPPTQTAADPAIDDAVSDALTDIITDAVNGAVNDAVTDALGDASSNSTTVTTKTPIPIVETIKNSASDQADIKTGIISFASNGRLYNEMGTSLTADTLIMGKNAQLIHGANYSLGGMTEEDDYYKMLQITHHKSDAGDVNDILGDIMGDAVSDLLNGAEQSDSVEKHFYPVIPHQATMNIKNVVLGENATVTIHNNSTFTGETFRVDKNGRIDIIGSSVTLSSDGGDSVLYMGENGFLSLKGYTQPEILEPEIVLVRDTTTTIVSNPADNETNAETGTDTTTQTETSASITVEQKVYKNAESFNPSLKVDIIQMDKSGTIDLLNGTIDTKKIFMADNGTINVGSTNENTSDASDASDSSDTTDNGSTDIDFSNLEDLDGSELMDAINSAVNDNNTETGTTDTSDESYSSDNALGDFSYTSGALTATDYIAFANNGLLNNSSSIKSPLVTFGAYGTLNNFTTGFNVTKLIMDHNATINNYAEMKSFVILGSDSVATMFGGNGAAASDIVDKEKFSEEVGGAFTGGVTKADGAENVKIVSNVGFKETLKDSDGKDVSRYYRGWLAGGVNVDNILIQQGELWGQDDIRGQIDISTDSTFRLVGNNVTIYDPISKLQDATNTKLIVDLDGNDTFYKTTNTIHVDNIVLLGGGIQIQNPTVAEKIILSSNTTVRLKGNYFVGDMVELNGDAANTTLDIDAGKDNVIYSTGDMRLDRVVVESGTFDINHQLQQTYHASNGPTPSAYEEGLELNTDTTANINVKDIHVNRIVRGQLAERKNETITNTTVNINKDGHLWVERNVDVDQLNMNGGTFEFMNKDKDNVVNVGNNIHVATGGQIAGDGVINLKNGQMDLDYAARLSVSTQLTEDKDIGTLTIVQADKAYSDADDIIDKGNAVVNMHKGSILDLRAQGNQVDKIEVSGTVNLADGTRIIVREIEANNEYELMSATQLNGNIDKLSMSFLWTGKELKNNNNTLTLKITGVQTLNEGISSTAYSENVWNIAQTMQTINNSTASNTIDPFLDSVFYADTAKNAVNVMNEYSPEGYLNTQQAALRTNRIFRQSALSELDAMRTYRDVENLYQKQEPLAVYNPNYYGRPGYEAYYNSWNSQRYSGRRKTRTDKGGLWAKPFVLSITQNDKDNMSGYKIESTGFTAGIDHRFGPISFGIMGMFGTGSINQNNKVIETDTTTYGAGIYGNFRPYRTRKFFDFYALWSQTKNESTHKINTLVESAKADFNTTTYSVGADMGYDMPLARNIIITPKIGIDYTKIEMDEIEEKGNGLALLKVKTDEMTSIQMPVEIKAAFHYGNAYHKFKPEVHARWTHEFGDTAPKGQSLFVNYNQPFAVSGLNIDRDTFTLGGSLLWLYNVSELEVGYDYDFSSSSSGHTLNVGYKYLF